MNQQMMVIIGRKPRNKTCRECGGKIEPSPRFYGTFQGFNPLDFSVIFGVCTGNRTNIIARYNGELKNLNKSKNLNLLKNCKILTLGESLSHRGLKDSPG